MNLKKRRTAALVVWMGVVQPAAAQAPVPRVRFFASVDYFLGDGAKGGAESEGRKAAQSVLTAGYDSVSMEGKAEGGIGGRLGALWNPLASSGIVIGEDPFSLGIGGSVGFVEGPEVRVRLDAKSASQGDGRFTYDARTRFLRVLADARIRVPLRVGKMGLLLGAGLGLARGWVRANLTPSGSLESVGRDVEEQSWTGLAWEISPALEIPIGPVELSAGVRYADFPRLKRRGGSLAIVAPMDWNPFGLFVEAAF